MCQQNGKSRRSVYISEHYNLPKLRYENIGSLNRPITKMEIECSGNFSGIFGNDRNGTSFLSPGG